MENKRYKVIATTAFIRDLKKLPFEIAKMTQEKKDELALNPYQGKKLTNVEAGKWRVKVGKFYRLRYDIVEDILYLYRIRHRKDVYKR